MRTTPLLAAVNAAVLAAVLAVGGCKDREDPAPQPPRPPPVGRVDEPPPPPPADAAPAADPDDDRVHVLADIADEPLGPPPRVGLRVMDDGGEPAAARAVVAAIEQAHLPSIAACGARTTYRGDVALQVTVLQEGKIEAIPGRLGKPLIGCIEDAAQTWKLPRQPRPRPMILVATLADAPPAPPGPPRLTVGLADDGDDEAAAAQVLRAVESRHRKAIERCVARAAYRGDIALELTVEPSGRTRDVNAAGADPETDTCLEGAAQAWRLPARAAALPIVLKLTLE